MKSKERKANINIEVLLNENNLPEHISWLASDSKKSNDVAKAFMLSFLSPPSPLLCIKAILLKAVALPYRSTDMRRSAWQSNQ